MNTHCTKELSRSLERYMQGLDRKARKAFCASPHKNKIQFWPLYACGCEYHQVRCCDKARGYTSVIYDPRLVSSMSRMGLKVGDKVWVSDNTAGCCAEQHAANDVLKESSAKRCAPPPQISDLTFTRPIRPRTRQRGESCIICQNIL